MVQNDTHGMMYSSCNSPICVYEETEAQRFQFSAKVMLVGSNSATFQSQSVCYLGVLAPTPYCFLGTGLLLSSFELLKI